MKTTTHLSIAVAAMLMAGAPRPAAAQGLSTLGARPAALGAFVAVADDASATAWNPAGLIYGPIFNVLIDFGRATHAPDWEGASAHSGARAGRTHTSLVALSSLPLGISYYRIRDVELETADGSAGEPVEDRQIRQVFARALVTSHLGATVLQSLTDAITVGATVRLVRGAIGQGTATAQSWAEIFERAEALEREGRTTADVDLGVLYAPGRARAGLVVRNVRQPVFGEDRPDRPAMRLRRHARVGVAWGNRWPAPPTLVLAADADVTRVAHPGGERRDVAAGVERWWRGRVLGLRGGARASTVGKVRAVVTGGVSVAVRGGLSLDVHLAGGPVEDRAWGVAARLSY